MKNGDVRFQRNLLLDYSKIEKFVEKSCPDDLSPFTNSIKTAASLENEKCTGI